MSDSEEQSPAQDEAGSSEPPEQLAGEADTADADSQFETAPSESQPEPAEQQPSAAAEQPVAVRESTPEPEPERKPVEQTSAPATSNLASPAQPDMESARPGATRKMSSVLQAKEDMSKSKEQLEQEKKAILAQRCGELDTKGMDTSQLKDKANELFDQIQKLLAEIYDLDQKFKRQQYDMMELAERARQMNKGKKRAGGRKDGAEADPSGRVSSKYTQAPPPIQLCSKYERRTDIRSYADRRTMFCN